MADFGVQATELSGPSAAGSQTVAPVQKPAWDMNTAFLGAVQPLADAYLGSLKNQDPLAPAVNDFAAGQNKIAQAQAQGVISPLEAQRRNDQLFSDIQQRYPGAPAGALQRALAKHRGDTEAATGIGRGADLEQKEIDRRVAMENDALNEGVKIGIFSPSMTNNQEIRPMLLDLVQSWRADTYATEQAAKAYERTRQQITAGQNDKKFDQDQSERDLKKSTLDLFQRNSTKLTNIIGTSIWETLAKVKSGETSGEDGIFAIQQQINAVRAQARTQLAASPDLISKMDGMLDYMFDMAKFQMAPENLASFTSDKNKLIIAQVQGALMQDQPILTSMAGIRNMVGDNAMLGVVSVDVTNKIMANLSKVEATGRTTIVSDGNKEVQKATYSSLDSTATALRTGAAINKDVDNKALVNNTKAIIRDLGTVRHDDAGRIKLTDTINFIGGPAVKYLIDTKQLTPEDLQTAKDAYQSLVRNDLMGQQSEILQTRIINGSIKGARGEPVPLREIVEIDVGPDGKVQLTPQWDNSTFGGGPGAASSGFRAQAALNEINRSLGGLATAVRVSAHAAGRTDYQQYFEENKAVLMPSFFPTEEDIKAQRAEGREYIGGNAQRTSNWRKVGDGKSVGK